MIFKIDNGNEYLFICSIKSPVHRISQRLMEEPQRLRSRIPSITVHRVHPPCTGASGSDSSNSGSPPRRILTPPEYPMLDHLSVWVQWMYTEMRWMCDQNPENSEYCDGVLHDPRLSPKFFEDEAQVSRDDNEAIQMVPPSSWGEPFTSN